MTCLNILFLADAVFADKPGGSRTVARELAQRLTAAGHRLTFLVGAVDPTKPERETESGINIVRYDGSLKGPAYVKAGRKAAEILCRKEHFDIVHTHFAYAAWGPLQTLPASIPRVRTFHGPWDLEGWIEDTSRGTLPSKVKALTKRLCRHEIEKHNLRKSDRVTVLSHFFERDVVERFGIPKDKIDLIPGGVDLKRFQPRNGQEAARQQLGLPQKGNVLLSVRRLAPRMGLDRLLKAMPSILSSHPDTLLVIGGNGPERQHLETLTSELNIQNQVKFTGFIPDELLASYYEAADLFILPTAALEGFGLVILEAFSCGTPVVGTPIGAIPEILNPLDPALVSTDSTPQALASAIASYLSRGSTSKLDPSFLHTWVRERYSWEAHTRNILETYQRAATQRGLRT